MSLVIGPNGAGKSAFAHLIYKSLPQGLAEFFPGHRQIYFSSDHFDFLGQPIDQLHANLYDQGQVSNRFRSAWSEDHLKSVLKRLTNDEFQYVWDIAESAQSYAPIGSEKGPLSVLNSIFKSVDLPVTFTIEAGQLRATRDGGSTYAIDRLSDGERAALLLVAAIIVQPINHTVVIDEPEKHLHGAIAGPLIAAAVRARLDLAYVFTTHALSLIEALKPDQILHVRSSQVVGPNDERNFDAHLMTGQDGLPDDVKASIAGSRKKLLFVEGTASSDDLALYTLLYPQWSIAPKGGADTVISNVRAVASNGQFTWLESRGIIDLDGRNQQEVAALQADGIHALLVPTIENVFCLKEVIEVAADVFSSLSGGSDPQAVMSRITAALPALFMHERANFIARRTLWIVNRQVSATKLSVAGLKNGVFKVDAVDAGATFDAVSADIDRLIAGNPFAALSLLPIKNTSILKRIAAEAGYPTVSLYKNTILHQIATGSSHGNKMKEAMYNYLPVLS
ncbi:AAA family ATPase [Sphingomonas sp. LR60]|uniref:AAA family ATPase n=1 Tax=Sphingomonas sp. LR60 TaxID=3050233 RepID=UPI002FE3BDBC